MCIKQLSEPSVFQVSYPVFIIIKLFQHVQSTLILRQGAFWKTLAKARGGGGGEFPHRSCTGIFCSMGSCFCDSDLERGIQANY